MAMLEDAVIDVTLLPSINRIEFQRLLDLVLYLVTNVNLTLMDEEPRSEPRFIITIPDAFPETIRQPQPSGSGHPTVINRSVPAEHLIGARRGQPPPVQQTSRTTTMAAGGIAHINHRTFNLVNQLKSSLAENKQ